MISWHYAIPGNAAFKKPINLERQQTYNILNSLFFSSLMDKCVASVLPVVLQRGERANSNSKESPCIKIPCVFVAWELQ